MAKVAGATERLGKPHPGDTLREDFLGPLAKTAEWLAEGLRLPLSEVTELLTGQRPVTAEIALRLNRFLGCSPDFWLGPLVGAPSSPICQTVGAGSRRRS